MSHDLNIHKYRAGTNLELLFEVEKEKYQRELRELELQMLHTADNLKEEYASRQEAHNEEVRKLEIEHEKEKLRIERDMDRLKHDHKDREIQLQNHLEEADRQIRQNREDTQARIESMNKIMVQTEERLEASDARGGQLDGENQDFKEQVREMQEYCHAAEKQMSELTEDFKRQVKLNMKINMQNQKLEKIIYGSGQAASNPSGSDGLKMPKALKATKSQTTNQRILKDSHNGAGMSYRQIKNFVKF